MAASIPSLGPKNKTIGSHPLIGYLLDIYTLNNLLLLFDGNKDKNYENHNMAQYVKEERKEMGLDTSNTTVGSYLYDNIRRPDPALHLQITKNGIEFLHMSIHLAPEWLSHGLKDNGIIHFYKDIHDNKVTGKKKYLLYAIIGVEPPINKPHSLHFTINEGFMTPSIVGLAPSNDQELQNEMIAIINVLNRIFDEDNYKYYIGNYNKIHNKHNNKIESIQLHPNINTVASIIDSRKNQHISRPNRGTKYIQMNNRLHNKIVYRKYTQRRSHNPLKNGNKRSATLKHKAKKGFSKT